MKSFYALVPFTDANGEHAANEVVNLPYDTDEDIANALSMIRYGVVSERAPEPEATPLPPSTDEVAQAEAQVEITTHDHAVNEAPAEEPQPGGDQPEANALAQEPTGAQDDPETSFFDARGDDGSFVKEGTPTKRPGRKRR
jgi:hypothetical protein